MIAPLVRGLSGALIELRGPGWRGERDRVPERGVGIRRVSIRRFGNGEIPRRFEVRLLGRHDLEKQRLFSWVRKAWTKRDRPKPARNRVLVQQPETECLR